jgi:hypothetical protein
MTGSKSRSWLRKLLLCASVVTVSGVIALVVAEIILRAFPIPGITYHSFYYDAETGGKYYPHTALIYRGESGVEIRRRSNAWGFPDVDHKLERAPGVLRMGFFGDSYVEALQVKSEDTFVQLIEGGLNAHVGELDGAHNRRGEPVTSIEAFAFGISGRGTLQSWLECMNWMAKCDLDYVIYVFVENDPADQIPQLKAADTVPYPIISADSFVVDYSFNDRYGYKTTWWHRAMQRIKSHSLVVSTIETRLKLLKSYGAKRRMTEADRTGGGVGPAPMAPSAWPPGLLPVGWTLMERVLDRWKRDVEEEGRHFVIIRVPREEAVAVPLAVQDTWAPRLTDYCAAMNIPLIDPTPYLLSTMHAGEKVYDDHFTPAGHRAFAQAFVDNFIGAEQARE